MNISLNFRQIIHDCNKLDSLEKGVFTDLNYIGNEKETIITKKKNRNKKINSI